MCIHILTNKSITFLNNKAHIWNNQWSKFVVQTKIFLLFFCWRDQHFALSIDNKSESVYLSSAFCIKPAHLLRMRLLIFRVKSTMSKVPFIFF